MYTNHVILLSLNLGTCDPVRLLGQRVVFEQRRVFPGRKRHGGQGGRHQDALQHEGRGALVDGHRGGTRGQRRRLRANRSGDTPVALAAADVRYRNLRVPAGAVAAGTHRDVGGRILPLKGF